ncbi:hypothetical protein LguiB_021401 [Lonicera macranthoides]
MTEGCKGREESRDFGMTEGCKGREESGDFRRRICPVIKFFQREVVNVNVNTRT